MQRELVLRLARDAVLLGHLLGRLAHRLAGGRLGDGGRDRHQVARPDAGPARRAGRRALFALPASTRIWLKRRECRIGMSESDSTPPAMMTSAWPRAIWSAALVMAWVAEAQARLSDVRRDARQELGQQAHLARHVRARAPRAPPGRRSPRRPRGRRARSGTSSSRAAWRASAVADDVAKDGAALGERRADAGDDGHPPPGPGVVHVDLSVRGRSVTTDVVVLFTRDGHHARDGAPALGVDRLEHLAAVQDPQRRHQPGELARAQQVVLRGRAPSRARAGRSETIPSSAGRRARRARRISRHPGTVKIIEHQNRIKTPELGPGSLEIHAPASRR